jgi:hypothetical protein
LFYKQWPASHGWFFLEEKLLIIFFLTNPFAFVFIWVNLSFITINK